MPSLANLLQMRLAAGESFPRVKPCAKTPQPRTAPSGRSIRPASTGPLVLANDTRSAMSHIVSKLVATPRSQALHGLSHVSRIWSPALLLHGRVTCPCEAAARGA